MLSLFAQQTFVKYLSGTDKDHTVAWDFYCTAGRNSGQWSKIQVPSNWEFQGFGSYHYGRGGQPEDPSEAGLYKYEFSLPAGWGQKQVFIVFEGSMTDTEVKINGQLAGDVHQGAFYRFKYNITKLLKPNGANLLEVKVNKHSANASVNNAERKADFWIFGGIFRPVYLEAVPQTYIDHLALDARANGSLNLDVYGINLTAANKITAQLQTIKGQNIGLPFQVAGKSGDQKISLQHQFKNIKAWNPEAPQLYQLLVSITNALGTVHQVKQRFGFRTVDVRLHDGIYVNNKKVIFKGVCRHSAWPESGRTMSKALSILDVKLMKEMNMNAVRMSHYPPDQHFLDVCDSLGLFVLDELTGWQNKYDTIVGHKLVKEMVVRDVNHPSIVLWDNGNEGGWNTGLDGDFDLYDPQHRHVLHPWQRFNGVDNKHYPDYNYIANAVEYGTDIYFPTEFIHGNYDGGSGAQLDDYWNLMLKHPYFAGGFLWSFADEGMIRVDKNGEMDTADENAPDGMVGPHREKEGSFYTIKEIWSPVVIDRKTMPPGFDGRLSVTNRYIYTNLNQCKFSWKLVNLPAPDDKAGAVTKFAGSTIAPNIEAGATGFIDLNLPGGWRQSDALYLTATDPQGNELFTWSWALKEPKDIAAKAKANANAGAVTTNINGDILEIKSGAVTYFFDTKSGLLSHVTSGGKDVPLSHGPVLAGVATSLRTFKPFQQGNDYVVQANFSGDKGTLNTTWTFASGQPAKLQYQYSQKGEADYFGITFNLPEDQITGMRWMGQGPYRVWKNRLKGQQFGVWHKKYNNTITGETWDYPEFKGYHAQLYWVTVENKQSPFTVYTEDENIYLQMLKPENSKHAPATVKPPFPDGDIGFLNAISPIGSKFHNASGLGPQSEKNVFLNTTPLSGTLLFDFH